MPDLREKADRLRELHRPGEPLVLFNVWDAVTARIVEELGFPAVATTSAGVAFAQGFPDGERISREAMLRAVHLVAHTVAVPVTADLEGAYGPAAQDARATALGAIDAGAAGLNFEDSFDHESLRDRDLQAERIAAMRAAAQERGVPLVINARTDAFLLGLGEGDDWRFHESVERANRYLQAGADCAFVPGVADEPTIERLVKAIDGPVNVLAGASSPSVGRLAQLGVARISVGSASIGYAMAYFRSAAQAVRDAGTFAFAAQRIGHADMNALFER